MSRNRAHRRTVLRTSGATLAALSGGVLAGTAAAAPDDGDGGDDGGGGGSGTPPSVSTGHSSVSGSEVTTHGEVTSLGSEDSADAWFEWGPYGDGLPYDTNIKIMYSTGRWCDGYDNCFYNSYGTLSSGTYEYRAVAANSYGKSEGSTYTFTI